MPKYYKYIDGWMDYESLYEDLLLNKIPDNGIFVEVGVWRGKSLAFMAELAKEHNKNIKIFGVDIFAEELDNHLEPYRITKNIFNSYSLFLFYMAQAKVLDRIIPLALFSEDASKLFYNNSIDAVFLDAAHDEENVIKDFESWIPRIKIGGYLAGHDYKDGIQPFVDKYFKENIGEKVTEVPPHCFIWKKTKEKKYE